MHGRPVQCYSVILRILTLYELRLIMHPPSQTKSKVCDSSKILHMVGISVSTYCCRISKLILFALGVQQIRRY